MEKTLADGEVIITSLMLKGKLFLYIAVLCIFGVFLKVTSNTLMWTTRTGHDEECVNYFDIDVLYWKILFR